MKKKYIAIIMVTVVAIITSGFIWMANTKSNPLASEPETLATVIEEPNSEPETPIVDAEDNEFKIHANAGAGEPVEIPEEFLPDDPLNNVIEIDGMTMEEMQVFNSVLEEKLAGLVDEHFNEQGEYTGEKSLIEMEQEIVRQALAEAKEKDIE